MMGTTFPLSSSLSPPGEEPQAEKQVEKVSTLSMVRRDTALLLRDFKQGASNWIHSLLDPNRAATTSSTGRYTCVCVCVLERVWGVCLVVRGYVCTCVHASLCLTEVK